MKKIKLINQNDYPDKIYITKTEKVEPLKTEGLSTTIKTSGCGICCAMMLAQFFDYELSMDEAIDLAYKSKANTSFGTKYKQYANALCDKFNLNVIRTTDKETLFKYLDNGGCCVVNVGGDHDDHIGLFSHVGHYIFIYKHIENDIYILDPGIEENKYLELNRKDKVEIKDNVVIADVKYLIEDILNREAPLFLFSKKPDLINIETIFNKIDELNNDYIKIWQDIVKIDSFTRYKEGVDKVGKYLIDLCAKQLWDIDILENEFAGNAICITMNKDSKLKPIALSGHMDTVFPINTIKTYIKEDKMYGPGCSDCKGGIVACLLAMKALKECGYVDREIRLILQSDEEVSSSLSNLKTIEYMIDCAKDAICFINTEMHNEDYAVISRKGIARYIMTFEGKAAHAGYCYNGKNAILEASHKIIELEKYKDPDGITINVGTINGGTTANTVAEKCEINIDVRFSNDDELKIVDKYINEIANKNYVEGVKTTCKLASKRIAMDYKDTNKQLLDKINKALVESGLKELKPYKTNGGSDAAYTSNNNIPTIDSMGVTGGNIHSKDEFAYLDSLKESAKRLVAIIYKLDDE